MAPTASLVLVAWGNIVFSRPIGNEVFDYLGEVLFCQRLTSCSVCRGSHRCESEHFNREMKVNISLDMYSSDAGVENLC
jgi:hypothetical protein